MACTNCEEFTCVKPVPTCANFLNIGFPFTATTGEVRIYVEKLIGGQLIDMIQKVNGYSSGILVDLSNPREQFYNEFDGTYKIWATNIEDGRNDNLPLTIEGVDYTSLGVEFVRTRGKKFNIVVADVV
jgi:hypothetical protein